MKGKFSYLVQTLYIIQTNHCVQLEFFFYIVILRIFLNFWPKADTPSTPTVETIARGLSCIRLTTVVFRSTLDQGTKNKSSVVTGHQGNNSILLAF